MSVYGKLLTAKQNGLALWSGDGTSALAPVQIYRDWMICIEHKGHVKHFIGVSMSDEFTRQNEIKEAVLLEIDILSSMCHESQNLIERILEP